MHKLPVDRLFYLIAAYNSGNITTEEAAEFQEWLESDEQNKQWYEEYCTPEKLKEAALVLVKMDDLVIRRKFIRRIRASGDRETFRSEGLEPRWYDPIWYWWRRVRRRFL